MCDATAFLAFRSLCFKTVGCKSSGARVMSAHQNKKISMIAAYAKGMRGDTERPVLEWDCQRIRGRIGCFTPDLDPWGYFPRSCRSFVVQLLGCSLHCKRGEVGRRLTVRPLPTPISMFSRLRKVPGKDRGCRLQKGITCKTKTNSKGSRHRPRRQEQPPKG